MRETTPLPPFAALIVAAGKGLRAGGEMPKQFRPYRGMPMLRYTALRLIEAGCDKIVLVTPPGMVEESLELLNLDHPVIAVEGGATRQQSVRAGLEALADAGFDHVLIHDAARPDLPSEVVQRLRHALTDHHGAIPVLPVVDSIALADGDLMRGRADRDTLRRVQTPQAFRFHAVLQTHRDWQGQPDASDDAQIVQAAGLSVALVKGDERLKKLTFASDFADGKVMMRIGQGFDAHRLETGEDLWLCGCKIEHDKGLSGHSDADVALHALVDALLGAIGDGDIGSHFPPSDPQWKGASSPIFVEHARKLVDDAGYAINNVDMTIICEAPKIGPHRETMRQKLAEMLHLDVSAISVKATTTEAMGFTGRGEGIAAQVIAAIQTKENI